MLVYNAILFVYISVLKASNQWKSTEKLVLQISKKTTFNYQDFIPTYLRLGEGVVVKGKNDFFFEFFFTFQMILNNEG